MDMTEKTLKQDYKFRGRIVNMRVDEALMPDGTTASARLWSTTAEFALRRLQMTGS